MFMKLRFNEKRATQAAARLLSMRDNRALNYMILLKLLYLVDRESLLRWGSPLTGDEYYSMEFGPVLSKTHDLITEMRPPEENNYWERYIQTRNFDVTLSAEPDYEELSDADDVLLREIFQKYQAYYDSTPFKLVDELHKILPEYKPVEKGQRIPLDYHDILVAGKKPIDEIRAIDSELNGLAWIQNSLRASC